MTSICMAGRCNTIQFYFLLLIVIQWCNKSAFSCFRFRCRPSLSWSPTTPGSLTSTGSSGTTSWSTSWGWTARKTSYCTTLPLSASRTHWTRSAGRTRLALLLLDSPNMELTAFKAKMAASTFSIQWLLVRIWPTNMATRLWHSYIRLTP